MAHTESGRILWPGEEVPCAAGCTQYPPLQAPQRRSRHKSGCWGACCRSCGRTLFLRPHYGDREEDLCWVMQERPPAGLEDLAHAMAEEAHHSVVAQVRAGTLPGLDVLEGEVGRGG